MLEIRPARSEEYAELGDLTAETYLAEGYCDEEYAVRLRDVAGRAAEATVLVALQDGLLLGGATVVTRGGSYSEDQPAGTAVIRALVVAPSARGKQVGGALVTACVEQARTDGCDRVRLSTQAIMVAAQRAYARAGFVRTPDEDWEPLPGLRLLTWALPLTWCGLCGLCGLSGRTGEHADCARKLALEPPRYCVRCRRRMVVQVLPTGWTARCVEHGTVTASI